MTDLTERATKAIDLFDAICSIHDSAVSAHDRRVRAMAKVLEAAPDPSPAPGVVEGQAAGDAESPLEWAVRKWHHEVANRPLENVHRAALDTTWRQVIRHFGGDAEVLCGPDHYTLVEQNPAALASLSQPAKGEREGGA